MPSLHLGAMSFTFVVCTAFPLGVFAAYNRGRIADSLARTLAFAGQSVPEFWLGIMLILVFVVYLNWPPAAGCTGGWTHWISAVHNSRVVLHGGPSANHAFIGA